MFTRHFHTQMKENQLSKSTSERAEITQQNPLNILVKLTWKKHINEKIKQIMVDSQREDLM